MKAVFYYNNVEVVRNVCTVANKKTRRLDIFSTRDFDLLKSCSTLTHLVPNRGGLKVLNKVQDIPVVQKAANV